MTNITLYLAALLIGTNLNSPKMPQSPVIPAVSNQTIYLNTQEQQFINLTNKERQTRHIEKLIINTLLVEVARKHSMDMAIRHYFSHYSTVTTEQTPMKRYLKALDHTPTWTYIGENILYSSVIDVVHGHKSLMNSEPHKKNIVNKEFEQIGVGIYESPTGEMWVTQLFLSQID